MIRNSTFPAVLDPYLDDMFEVFAKLQPSITSIEKAEKHFEHIKAEVSAALIVVYHQAKRTGTYDELYNSFKNAKGATDTIRFINYLADGRLVNERLIQAANEMGSVIAVIAPEFNKLDEPIVEEVLAKINERGTVSEIHSKHVDAEKKRIAAGLTDEKTKAKREKTELAASRGMTYEQLIVLEKAEAKAAKHEANRPKREKLLQSLLQKGEVVFSISVDAPDETVFVKVNGKLVMLQPDHSLTILDAVA